MREVPVVRRGRAPARSRAAASQPSSALRLRDVDERVAVRRLVVPLGERREPARARARAARSRPAGPGIGVSRDREPAWSISACRSARTVPNSLAPMLIVSPARLGALGGERRSRRRGPRRRAAGSGSRPFRGSWIRRPSRIQSKRISKTPSRSGPMNVFGRTIATSSPRRPKRAADLLRLDLRLAVPADADERVVLVDRMLLRDAVDRGRRDEDDAAHARLGRGGEHVRRAADVHRADRLARGLDRERGGRVHDHVGAGDELARVRGARTSPRSSSTRRSSSASSSGARSSVRTSCPRRAAAARGAGRGSPRRRRSPSACGRTLPAVAGACRRLARGRAAAAASSRRAPRPRAAPPSRPRPRRAGSAAAAPGCPPAALEPRPHDEVVRPRPRASASATSAELHQQHLPVARRPESVDVRQAQDRQVDAGREQEPDQHRREPREARGRRSAAARARPARRRARARRARRPRAIAADRCTQSASSDHPTSRRRRPSGPTARGPRRARARAGTPPTAATCGRSARRGRAAPSTSAKPSVIAMNAAPKRVPLAIGDRSPYSSRDERELQRVLRPQQEREDPHLEHGHRADARDQ